MLNKVFQLVQPRQFEPIYKDVLMDKSHILVRPTHLSICHADQRYYQGQRPEEVLNKKLPMALIHEGVGVVQMDPTGVFPVGTPVVMIANTPTEKDSIVADNYLPTSHFRGSGFDGFMQEYVSMKSDLVLPLPNDIQMSVAAFTEMVSVSYHAVSRFLKIAHERKDTIGIWGDGNLGYITALLIKYLLPNSRIVVFGAVEYKLQDFAFADDTFLITDVPESVVIDHAFECVGGPYASKAINQIIDHILPEGTISLMGVSEELVPINTRMVLERGLRMFGSSRSSRKDYEGVLEIYRQHPEIMSRLEKIIGVEIPVFGITDIAQAFETDIHKNSGKTIMEWKV